MNKIVDARSVLTPKFSLNVTEKVVCLVRDNIMFRIFIETALKFQLDKLDSDQTINEHKSIRASS